MASNDLSIIIPAAGISYKMKSYGAKSLLHIYDGRTILRRQLDIVRKKFPEADVFVVLGYQKDKVIKTLPRWVRVIENTEYENTSIVRSISLALQATITKKALVFFGDLIFNREALDIANLNKSAVAIDSNGHMNDNEVDITISEDKIVRFDYDLKTKNKFSQIFLLTNDELHKFKVKGSKAEKKRLMCHEILNEIIDIDNGEFVPFLNPKARIVEVDSSKDIQRAEEIFNS